jgi:hypothetical protein
MSNVSEISEADRPAVVHVPGRVAPCEVVITCYDNVPPSLGVELDQLYHHINSSLCHHAVAHRARDAHAYVARRDGQPLAIFLFQREGRAIMVFNEMMQLAAEEIGRFATYIFNRFPSATRISFSKIGTDIGLLSLPSQQYGRSEDIVVSLPDTPEEYFSLLGAKLRHNIRHQMKAISAAFPGFSFHTYENGAIAESHVSSLIKLKNANTDEKRMKFGITPEESTWMIERAKTNGLLIVALLDGEVCGGSLSLRIGDHYFAHLNAYDARFAKYSLGMLCCYLAMNEKIRRGACEAHLSRGRNQYKFKLLGVRRDMANLDVYRSRMHYYRHVSRVCRNAFADLLETQKLHLLENEHRSGLVPSLAGRLVKAVRKIKRSNFRPAS